MLEPPHFHLLHSNSLLKVWHVLFQLSWLWILVHATDQVANFIETENIYQLLSLSRLLEIIDSLIKQFYSLIDQLNVILTLCELIQFQWWLSWILVDTKWNKLCWKYWSLHELMLDLIISTLSLLILLLLLSVSYVFVIYLFYLSSVQLYHTLFHQKLAIFFI